MFWTIVRKEWLDTCRDGRFRVSAVVLWALLFSSLFISHASFMRKASEHQQAEQAERTRWLTQEAGNPHSAAHYSIWAFKPLQPLMTVDRGLEPYLGTTVWLEAHRQNPLRYRPAEDATAWQRLGELTQALTLQLLMPLLVLLLSFRAISGEREGGTLRLLAAQGVSVVTLAWAKAVAIFCLLGALLVPPTLISMVVIGGAEANLGFALSMVLIYALYLFVFVLVGVALSAWLRQSSLALAVGLAFWLLNGLIVPRVATELAASWYAVPSVQAFQAAVDAELKNGIDGHSPQSARDSALLARTLTQYGVDSVKALPVNWDAIRMQAGEEHGNAVFDRHYGSLFGLYRLQQVTRTWFALVAPGIAVQQLSMALAGTDWNQHEQFIGQAETYRRMLVRTMNEDMRDNSKTGEWEYEAGAALWQKVPAFEFSPPTLAEALADYLLSLCLLLGWVVAGGILVTLSARTTSLV